MLKKLTLILVSILFFIFISFYILSQNHQKSLNQKGIVQNKNVIHWKMANTWGKGMPVIDASTLRFARHIKEMTNGRLIIEVDPSNKHKAPFGIFDMVRTNQYQMGHTASYYWKGKDTVMPLYTTVPFEFNFLEQYAWFYFAGGQELMEKSYAKHGLLSFPAGNTGVQMGGWFKKPLKSLKDMQGLKMRIPGLAGDIISRLGARPTNIPPGELYTSLQLGTIDALEWISPALDIKMGFGQIADYYYTGWHEPSAELQFLINRRAFEELPEDLKIILKVAMREAAYDMTVDMFYQNAITWAEMKKSYPNVKIKTFPEDIITELKKQTQVVLSELSKESSEIKQVIESRKTFFKLAKEWTAIGEKPYLEIRD